jgi:hypothetical protein
MCFTVMATAQESTIKPLLSQSYPGLHVRLLAGMRSEHNNCLRLGREALRDGYNLCPSRLSCSVMVRSKNVLLTVLLPSIIERN